MIYVCEHHDEFLTLWRQQGLQSLNLTHVDFHDDLRGLLVDCARGRAYPIGRLARGNSPVDDGNFLAHAVLEGRLNRVRWVHFARGGRAWDLGIVRYETDLFALHHRLCHVLLRGKEYSFGFKEIGLKEWQGLVPGDNLSIDWDCFASILQDRGGIEGRVGEFLDRMGPEIPADTYVAYSPDYSRSTLEAFKGLLTVLERRFGQRIEWLSPGLQRGKLNLTGVEASLPRNPVMKLILAMRRIGIY